MPVDSVYARNLAAYIKTADIGDIGSDVAFTYDPYLAIEEITAQRFVLLWPDTVTEKSEAHRAWATTIELAIGLFAAAAPNDGPTTDADYDAILDDWDAVIDLLKNDPKLTNVERIARYDLEQSQTRARVVAYAELKFAFFD